MAKIVQWNFSLIINRGWAFVPTGLYFLLPVMRINLQVLAVKLFEWDDFCSGWSRVYLETRELNPGLDLWLDL
jgi:hypothetical protein